ncbi:radical SAM protein [Thermoproteota archaeon]
MRTLETLVTNSSASEALEKAIHGEELDFNDGVSLMDIDNVHILGLVADHIRKKLVGDTVTFVSSYNLNYSNICVARCSICAFYRPYKKGKEVEGGYTLSIPQALKKVKEAVSKGATEIHIVGGFNPDLSIEYYENLFKDIKTRWSYVTIKALTLIEIIFISKLTNNSITEVFSRLKAAGIDANAGGGAEIFDPEVRSIIATAPKCSGKEWLKAAELAHKIGIRGNSTMLYGHVEKTEHRVDHILKIRELQQQTSGFLSFIPLKYSPENTELFISGKVKGATSALDDLRVYATSRLLLAGSINNIAIYWIALGKKVAQTVLTYGGNDLVGTAFNEKVYRAAGKKETSTKESIVHIVREINRIPAERDTFYNILNYL